MNTKLAELIAEEQMAKALWLSSRRRLEEFNQTQDQKKKMTTTANRHISKRMKQMTKTY